MFVPSGYVLHSIIPSAKFFMIRLNSGRLRSPLRDSSTNFRFSFHLFSIVLDPDSLCLGDNSTNDLLHFVCFQRVSLKTPLRHFILRGSVLYLQIMFFDVVSGA